jgi:LemA protein
MTVLWISLAIAAVLVLGLVIGVYNRLVTLSNRYKSAYSQIDVQLKRRYDLIPNLVETAKAYMAHERETLESVISARNEAAAANARAAAHPEDPSAIMGIMGAEALLTGRLGRFLARVEAYPDLKASQTMTVLMEELTSTENRIAFARQHYNDSVMLYNTTRERFPNVLIAGPFGFQPAKLFELESAAEREAPRVTV